ncbi:peptide/nickel transport system substrate-binding protein [Virgibacillus natechei]|uniref:Peptide/nickel transport system substrate-binding protein n=1 Tax=Virgibacillus natechei TaxID=1216297 RepID=A0ABS4ICM2_9BACI|nr:ABC transporter substrate-binding protein [Virgibacillus natechei]MBP1968603.1 peptide/nickel transport system substrate-binding protein [Virgibacillus natechei]UZD13713.1 ABC transporter substrate-binding protein [Virgibacillus natechei]
MKYNKLLLLLLLSFVISACSGDGEENANETEKEELVMAIDGEPDDGFDPTTGWGRYGSPLFQSTLFKQDADFTIQNDVGQNYEVSNDGLEWTVELRDDVLFSDGEALTADDVVFTFETAADSGSIIDLSNMEKVEAIQDDVVEFTLKEPQSTFIYLLVSTGIVPEHLYDDTYNENPVGSGPFQLEQWDKGQQLIVTANPHYYGEKPPFEKLTFLFLSEDATFAAAQAGEVDVASVPPAFAKEDVPGMRLVELDSVDNRGIMFPYESAGGETDDGFPIGNDVTAGETIRKAINLAIDREALVDGVLEGFGSPAYSVADGLPWWNSETVFEDDKMDEAKDMLDEAGWKENENGVREKDGLEAAFTLLYPADDQSRQSLSIAFADMIEPLGIDVSTEGKSWNELETLMYSHPVMMGWGSHDPLEMYNLYSTETRGEGYYNANFYSNSVVDEYMNQAMQATTEDEANRYWQKAQWDGETGFSAKGDSPWAWLVNLDHLYYVHEELEIGEQKVQPHGHGWPVTDLIEQWHWAE